MADIWPAVKRNLNFFRIHVLFFTFGPLIFSGIFYAANGETHIRYIDALFNCVSAFVVCGLATVDLSSLTGFQQALLFIQSAIGNPVVVSWVMVYIRRRYFAKRFEHIVEAEIAKRKATAEQGLKTDNERTSTWGQRMTRVFTRGEPLTPVTEASGEGQSDDEKEGKHKKRPGVKALRKLRTDMIRRMDDAPKPVGPNGWISEEPVQSPPRRPRAFSVNVAEVQEKVIGSSQSPPRSDSFVESEDRGNSPGGPGAPILARSPTLQQGNTRNGVPLGHTMTVEFKTPNRELRGRRTSRERRPSVLESQISRSPTGSRRYSTAGDVVHDDRGYVPGSGGVPLTHRSTTMRTQRSHKSFANERSTKDEGFGGFPYPTDLLLRLFKKLFPGLERRLVRTVTMPSSQTMSTIPRLNTGEGTRSVNYISFDAIIGRNSKFHLLTEENLEELGGVEYRALTALLWIVAGYHFGTQLIAFCIIAPYMSISRWRSAFEPPNLHRYVPPPWFSAFQIVSAYTNSGMSLVDQSMIPFQEAYPLIFVLAFLIVAGNTAFPILLRFTIWIITKLVPFNSRLNETLHFLLDHPRRCFVYLFPSHQTWFLLTVLVILNSTDWFFFLVLDIGSASFEAIPLGVRFAIGLLQATCVRASGFATVTISNLAPAVQALYVMMMYISVYPIALSVRATNVYEEKSLGVFDDAEEEDEEEEPNVEGPRVAVWGRYLAWHARRQLAFDMWWLGLALFLLCIIERSKIQNQDNLQWFTIFTIIFELISAYGGVGLSLGVPYANFSFAGALTPLSKLIVIGVMIRGRHRGLPVAIDRAVMLPFEFKKSQGTTNDDENEEVIVDEDANNQRRAQMQEDAGPVKSSQEKVEVESSTGRSQ